MGVFHNPEEIVGGFYTMLNSQNTISNLLTSSENDASDTVFREMTEADQDAFHPVPESASLGITPNLVYQRFEEALDYVCDHIDEYVSSPGIDFSRRSRFDPATLMKFLILMGSGSSICEINKFFPMDQHAVPPYNSTFCEARKKLNPEALYEVFLRFTSSFPELRTFKGYRLIGVDGSAVNIPLNKSEPETLHQNKENHKCFSQCYFNGAYDLLNAIYVDAVISTLQKTDERSALLAMSHRSSIPGNSVFVADRGYGGWKMFAGLDQAGRKFAIREKDKDSQCIFRSLDLSEDEEFDIVRTVILTNKQTKETLSNPRLYRIVMSNQDFPYLDRENHYYALKLRFVRREVAPGKYICIITNLLDQEKITAEDLQYIYALRWSHEGSCRVYKYTIGVLHFHARQFKKVRQELYAKMAEFNICQLIAGCVPMDDDSGNLRVLTQEEYEETCRQAEEPADHVGADMETTDCPEHTAGKKYRYKPNLSAAITNIKSFLTGHGNSEILILRIKRYLVPIRPGRSFSRNVKRQSATTLLYRAS